MRAFRLLELAQAAPAFERRLDAPLVGRERELAALREALERPCASAPLARGSSLGLPGDRQVAARRASSPAARRRDDAEGRCLSYGDGITYWPLRERPSGEGRRRGDGARRGRSRRSRPRLRRPPPRSRGPSAASARRSRASGRSCSCSTTSTGPSRPCSSSSSTSSSRRGADPRRLHRPRGAARGAPGVPRGIGERDRSSSTRSPTTRPTRSLDGLGGAARFGPARRARRGGRGQSALPRAAPRARAGGRARRAAARDAAGAARGAPRPARPGRARACSSAPRWSARILSDDVSRCSTPRRRRRSTRHLQALARPGSSARRRRPFRFRHVLIQEAVYRAAPKRLRAELHERFADRLEQTVRDRRRRRVRRLPPRAGVPPATELGDRRRRSASPRMPAGGSARRDSARGGAATPAR